MNPAVVRVEPGGFAFEATSGETIMAAAARAGLSWPTVCGGQGSCRTCFVRVIAHADHLSPVGPWEREGIAALGPVAAGPEPVRLACQAKPQGDVIVRKPGVRPGVEQAWKGAST